MRSAHRFILIVLPLFVACAGGSSSAGDLRPATLAFSAPDDPVVTYSQADTGEVVLDMGGQVVSMDMRTNAVLDMAFASAPGGLQVTTEWRDLDASMTSPMTPPQRLDQDGVDGPLVFNLGPRGAVEVVRVPEVAAGMGQLLSPTQTAVTFFPRLPGRAPAPGMTWTDTIQYVVDEGGVDQSVRTRMKYTVRGDTTVAGRTLLRVDMDGSQSYRAKSRQQGMEIEQDVSGAVGGFFLWDLATGVMDYQFSETDMSGTMEVDAAPYPLEIRISLISHVARTGTPAQN